MNAPTHLTFVEEFVLLALDDNTGALRPTGALAFSYALAGALLSELALLNRIDTDPDRLMVLDATPTGNHLLDTTLATIAAEPRSRPVSFWLSQFSAERNRLESEAFDQLVARGILRREEKKILWVIGVRRYPTVDNRERTEVRTRLAALILGDDLPDPRDAVMLALLNACGLTLRLFPGPEFTARSTRIATLARMDLVGREVGESIDRVIRVVSTAFPLGV